MNLTDLSENAVNYEQDFYTIGINSNNHIMIGRIFTPEGDFMHPTMIILHGFPGDEKNFDLAREFKSIGWNVLIFHYRGSWGSEGCFSFENVLDDIKAAFSYITEKETIKKYKIDKEKIILMGYSVGGFASLLTAKEELKIKAYVSIVPFDLGLMGELINKSIEEKKLLQEMFENSMTEIKGTSAQQLIDEVANKSEEWNLSNNLDKLLDKSVLMIAGTNDKVSKPEHIYPFIERMLSAGALKFEYKFMETDHSFKDKRKELVEVIEMWLIKNGFN